MEGGGWVYTDTQKLKRIFNFYSYFFKALYGILILRDQKRPN